MLGWFMIEYKFYDNAVRVTIGEFSKYIEIHDSDGDYVVSVDADGVIEIYDAAIDSYIVIDSENQAILIANAILKICENQNADN